MLLTNFMSSADAHVLPLPAPSYPLLLPKPYCSDQQIKEVTFQFSSGVIYPPPCPRYEWVRKKCGPNGGPLDKGRNQKNGGLAAGTGSSRAGRGDGGATAAGNARTRCSHGSSSAGQWQTRACPGRYSPSEKCKRSPFYCYIC